MGTEEKQAQYEDSGDEDEHKDTELGWGETTEAHTGDAATDNKKKKDKAVTQPEAKSQQASGWGGRHCGRDRQTDTDD